MQRLLVGLACFLLAAIGQVSAASGTAWESLNLALTRGRVMTSVTEIEARAKILFADPTYPLAQLSLDHRSGGLAPKTSLAVHFVNPTTLDFLILKVPAIPASAVVVNEEAISLEIDLSSICNTGSGHLPPQRLCIIIRCSNALGCILGSMSDLGDPTIHLEWQLPRVRPTRLTISARTTEGTFMLRGSVLEGVVTPSGDILGTPIIEGSSGSILRRDSIVSYPEAHSDTPSGFPCIDFRGRCAGAPDILSFLP